MTTTIDELWKEVVDAPGGHIFHDETTPDGYRIRVIRGAASLCAYVGVPPEHPWAGKSYDEIDNRVPVHGGLTFATDGGKKKKDLWPGPHYWFGWDYGHAGDYATYYDEPGTRSIFTSNTHLDDYKWTVPEVVDKARAAVDAFRAAGGEWRG